MALNQPREIILWRVLVYNLLAVLVLLQPMMTHFQQKVYAVVKKIPKGQTLTYKQVAEKIGRPNAYRAVGMALKKNYSPDIPCHRVIRSDGQTGGYNRGVELKKKILKKERAMI